MQWLEKCNKTCYIEIALFLVTLENNLTGSFLKIPSAYATLILNNYYIVDCFLRHFIRCLCLDTPNDLILLFYSFLVEHYLYFPVGLVSFCCWGFIWNKLIVNYLISWVKKKSIFSIKCFFMCVVWEFAQTFAFQDTHLLMKFEFNKGSCWGYIKTNFTYLSFRFWTNINIHTMRYFVFDFEEIL